MKNNDFKESAPIFTKRLIDRRVEVNSTVRLSCQVYGLPVPAVMWYKDGEPLDFAGTLCCVDFTAYAKLVHKCKRKYFCKRFDVTKRSPKAFDEYKNGDTHKRLLSLPVKCEPYLKLPIQSPLDCKCLCVIQFYKNDFTFSLNRKINFGYFLPRVGLLGLRNFSLICLLTFFL